MKRNDYLNPQESEGFPGFYDIPGYKNYAISKEGQVINKTTKKYLAQQQNIRNYWNCSLPVDEDDEVLTFRRQLVHRLMAKTFLYPGDDYKGKEYLLQVNHIDANTSNNKLNNLEWTTPSENMQHAVANGRVPEGVPVEARNPITKKVLQFPTLISCARHFNLDKDQMRRRLMCGPERVFPEMQQYRWDNFDQPWPEPEHPELQAEDYGRKKGILVRDLLNGNKVTEYAKLQDCARAFGVVPAVITSWIKKEGQPVLPGFIQAKLKSDPTPWREVKDPILEYAQQPGTIVIQTIDVRTGKKEIFTSAAACARKYGILPTTLDWRLKNKSLKPYDGIRFGYYPFD